MGRGSGLEPGRQDEEQEIGFAIKPSSSNSASVTLELGLQGLLSFKES